MGVALGNRARGHWNWKYLQKVAAFGTVQRYFFERIGMGDESGVVEAYKHGSFGADLLAKKVFFGAFSFWKGGVFIHGAYLYWHYVGVLPQNFFGVGMEWDGVVSSYMWYHTDVRHEYAHFHPGICTTVFTLKCPGIITIADHSLPMTLWGRTNNMKR